MPKTSYPKYTREQDSRFKVTSEKELEIIELRNQGFIYRSIADMTGVSMRRCWEICLMHLEPERWEKLKEKKKRNQQKHRKKKGISGTWTPKNKAKKQKLMGKKLAEHENKRATDYYHRVKNTPGWKEKRSKRRKELYQQKKSVP